MQTTHTPRVPFKFHCLMEEQGYYSSLILRLDIKKKYNQVNSRTTQVLEI